MIHQRRIRRDVGDTIPYKRNNRAGDGVYRKRDNRCRGRRPRRPVLPLGCDDLPVTHKRDVEDAPPFCVEGGKR